MPQPPERALAITGMTCASCAARVQSALEHVPGVLQAQVNFATRAALIEGTVAEADLVKAVEAAGYGAMPLEHAHDSAREELVRARSAFLFSAALAAPVFALGMLGVPAEYAMQAAWLSAALTTLELCLPGRGFFIRGAKLALKFQTSMDTLVALGAGAGYAFSLYVLIAHGHTHLYFESAAVIVALVLMGKFLEERARYAAGDAVRSLMELMPATTIRLRMDKEEEVPVPALVKGDRILLKPGSRVPVDGVVERGEAALDEAHLTGEPMPVTHFPGDQISSGAIVVEGSLVIRALKIGKDTSLAQTTAIVERAIGTKANAQRLSDKVSAWFVPIVLLLSAVTLGVWLLLGADAEGAILPALSVLLIACPCALGLATPVVVMVSAARAAQAGILVRSAAALERAGGIQVLLCDKTGTLTAGRPEVTAAYQLGRDPLPEIGPLIAAGARLSEHPLAQALRRWADSSSGLTTLPLTTSFLSTAGQGFRVRVGGRRLTVGSPSYVAADTGIEAYHYEPQRLPPHATAVAVALDRKPAAIFGLEDRLRPGSAQAVKELRAAGIEVRVATGDREGAALSIAREAGIEAAFVRADLSPQDKFNLVEELKIAKKRVGFVGDGVNDAAALSLADTGFAIGTGAAVAMQAADITLKVPDLSKVLETVRIARAARRIMIQNLYWAFGYNVLAIPVAALGLLNPMLAAGAMALSSVSVVLNSLRLRGKHRLVLSPAPHAAPSIAPPPPPAKPHAQVAPAPALAPLAAPPPPPATPVPPASVAPASAPLAAPAAPPYAAQVPSASTASSAPPASVTLVVTGMTCAHCVGAVQKALLGVAGVAQAEVELSPGRAVVAYDPARGKPEQMTEAVRAAGYQAQIT